jgi:hypothetical protein
MRFRSRLFGVAYLGFTAIIVASSVYALWVGSWTIIAFDQWRIYADYLSRPFPSSILAVQNGHRPVVPGLFFLADLYLFGANNYFLSAVGIVLAFLLAGCWSWLAWRETETDLATRALCGGLPWIFVFWLGNSRTLGHGSEAIQNFLALDGLLLGVGATLASRTADRGLHGRPWLSYALAASVGCLIATFSFGSGIVSWPVTIGVGLLAGAPAAVLVVLGGGLLGSLLMYAGVSSNVGTGLSPVGLFETLLDAAVWLGSPLSRVITPFRSINPDTLVDVYCAVLGAIGLLLALVLVTRWSLRRQAASDLENWCIAVIAFAAGTALLVALARGTYFSELPAQRVAPRYVIWSSVFWAGLLILLGLEATRRKRRLSTRTWQGAVALVTLGLLPAHNARNMEYGKYQLEHALIAVGLNIRDDEMTKRLHPRPQEVYTLADWLRVRGFGINSWRLLGAMEQPLDPVYRVTSTNAIGATPPALTFAGLPEGRALHFSGTVADRQGLSSQLVALDEEGVVRGVGRIGGEGHQLARRVGFLAPVRPLYFGSIPRYSDGSRYTIVALARDGRSAVRLAVIPLEGREVNAGTHTDPPTRARESGPSPAPPGLVAVSP